MNAMKQHERYQQLVLDELENRTAENEREIMRAFALSAMANVDVEDLEERKPVDVYGALYYCWRFLQESNPDQPKISLFNPSFEHHGWQSRHTAVLVLARNLAFLEESIRLEFSRRNITIHFLVSSDLLAIRDHEHRLRQLLPGTFGSNEKRMQEEVLIYLEVSRHSSQKDLESLSAAIQEIIDDVTLVVQDFEPMCERVKSVSSALQTIRPDCDAEERAEYEALLDWLMQRNFTFLGFEELTVNRRKKHANVTVVEDSSLGLLKRRSSSGCADLEAELRQYGDGGNPSCPTVAFFKSALRSRVHRIAYPDYVAVRRYDKHGKVAGEYRLLGLFTAVVYTTDPELIPVLRRKVTTILDRSGINAERYRARGLQRVLEVLPRDELFHCDVETLYQTAMRIYHIQERRKIRMFVRPDQRGRFISCLVYMPRDIYRTDLRQRIQDLLSSAFGAEESEFNTFFSESVLIRTHFLMRLGPKADLDYDERELERSVIRIAQQWEDLLANALYDDLGEEQGARTLAIYAHAFPPGYCDDYDPPVAVSDIRKFAEIGERGLGVTLYRNMHEPYQLLRLRLYSAGHSLDLSDVIPILENLGMRVLGERPYRIDRSDSREQWIHDFTLQYSLANDVDVQQVREVFEEAFLATWDGRAESDSFNRLVLGTRLNWREIAVLRALARYMKQVRYPFSDTYIAETLGKHLVIALSLVELFQVRFDPALDVDDAEREQRELAIVQKVLDALENVEQLNEDRIVRYYLALIRGTLRTNYYQPTPDGRMKDYFSFKLDARHIPDLPRPVPAYEIFVYSPRVEGVHLRGGKVARGGLRWSDRFEDFRTEVLGLVKAQQVKNAVIVPVGAKGGFVAKQLSVTASREEIQKEGIDCYQTFIRALLDVTDNLAGDQVLPPPNVVRKDEDDTYLVVAADKGTATFSDTANKIALEYGFWLGDAFASGGSNGYDHKKMGITARGAWVSVQRHFREMSVDVQKQDFTVVGVGDMGGDVFGNGMLLSEHICLLGAFNHLHIFVDPRPDAAASFVERQRLFDLPRSSWGDYDKSLISEGGGIFSRAAKSIQITPQMQLCFGITTETLTPNELITAMLCAEVDLVWNGGIGTYVKAASESHADVGDKANDGLRVNGRDLRCRVVGEGGNLGLTQLGRVEFALNGGRCFTDFIDNAAGVDCSDHEVNVKILLNQLVADGDLTEKQRSQLLEEMTEDVAKLVLHDNYRQTQAISISVSESVMRVNEYRRLITGMEAAGHLDRSLEFLPDDETLQERRSDDLGLSAPELSVLTSYIKGWLKEVILESDIPDNSFMSNSVRHAFPNTIRERYPRQMAGHKLRREIVATQIANDIVDLMGLNFIERLIETTAASVSDIIRAYVVAHDVYRLDETWAEIEALDNQVPASVQINLMSRLQRQMRLATRWFLRNRNQLQDPGAAVDRFSGPLQEISAQLGEFLQGAQLESYQERYQEIVEAGVPENLAARTAGTRAMVGLLGIIDAAESSQMSLREVAYIDFQLIDRLHLYWFAKQITYLKVDNYWQAMARESFLDELDWQSRSICGRVVQSADFDGGCDDCVDDWIRRHDAELKRWFELIADIRSTAKHEYAMYSVAVRGLLELARDIGG